MTHNIVHVVDGKITKSQIGTIEEQKNRISTQLRKAADDDKKLVIHFHGGLVKENQAIADAERLGSIYSEAGAETLFVVWPSDMLSIIKTNLDEILSKRLAFKALKWLVKKRYKRVIKTTKSLETSIPLDDDAWFKQQIQSESPFSDFNIDLINERKWTKKEEEEYITELLKDDEIQSLLEETFTEARKADLVLKSKKTKILEADIPESLAYVRQLNASIIAPIDKSAKGLIDWISPNKWKRNWAAVAVKTLKNTIQRKRNGSAHTWYATLLEEFLSCFYGDKIASGVWGLMKNDISDAFTKEKNTFGRFLLKELDALPARPKIFLSAHSAGAIYASRLIEHDTSPEGYDIGWIAPAINYTQFAALLRNHSNKIRNFRMFGMNDSLEKSDTLVGNQKWIYPSSLLYFVSGVCERNRNKKRIIDQCILGMQRYYNSSYRIPRNRRTDVNQVRHFLDGGNNRVVWSKSSGELGLNSDATDHGDFDNNEETLKSMKHLIQVGFES